MGAAAGGFHSAAAAAWRHARARPFRAPHGNTAGAKAAARQARGAAQAVATSPASAAERSAW